MQFNKDDVLKVARAVVDEGTRCEYQGAFGNYEYLYVCIFCGSEHPDRESFKHALDCPVLIAQDLLTGA